MRDKIQQKAHDLKGIIWRSIRRPAMITAVAILVLIVLIDMLVPLEYTSIKNLIISVLSTVFGALVLIVFFDIRDIEKRISDLNNTAMVDIIAGIMAHSPTTFSLISKDNLNDICRQAIIANHSIQDDEDMNRLIDLCMTEMNSKVTGVYSSKIRIARDVYPHYFGECVDSWKMQVHTEMTMKNASTVEHSNPLRGRVTSRALEHAPEYANILVLKEFSVDINGELVYSLLEPIKVECATDDDGVRKWEDYFPVGGKVPKTINPSETISYIFDEEFFIPVAEEIKVRWVAPRKGLQYKIKLHKMDNVEPCITLTGCSICEKKRKHGCHECTDNNSAVTIDSKSSISIDNRWVGSEMGINVEWDTKQKQSTKDAKSDL